ncbi:MULTISPECIES: HD domain-containing protein [Carnobacterium]|uniref:HD domain-containing protein n=1 Tax=Carnobacterium antarcticum TaxID=2126436 RepID=A0ABW4NRB1_9LACT|nr:MULTISPECIES: HD domain-containing protein [unclassified Carnobacterium]ALV22582.1 Deoxyguanosinetriphosphate triphosphohydrolase [Carnobacterium sp. CP1]QQP70493.1 HD domain-containing protein [Carnobacterium sp. CS13]
MPRYDANQQLPMEQVFRDPVHDYIHVQHQVILDLIDSREFQRLRRIKQLGTSSFTFHGAEHSRFTHSLGVYEITRRICDKFARNYATKVPGDGGWDDSERLVVLCAALLHDIGHGPYSHTFERIFQTDHEAITVEIITSPTTEVHQILAKVALDFPGKVASVIQKTYSNPQVVQLISSQIDADRMDYLLRDAYFTGVNYGTFDLTRILRVIRPYKDGIAFQISGMHAVEDYIVSRYQMYMQVYFHPVSRSMEVILDHLLKRAKRLYEESDLQMKNKADLLVPFFDQTFTLEDYLKLDDGVLSTYFTLWRDEQDPILSDLATRFLDRKPFKSVNFSSKYDEPILHKLQVLIQEAGYDIDYYTAINNSYDLPYDFYRPNQIANRTQIELMYQDGSFIELSKVSEIVSSLTGKVRGDERFYFPKEFLKPKTPKEITLFEPIYQDFKRYIKNDAIIQPTNPLEE